MGVGSVDYPQGHLGKLLSPVARVAQGRKVQAEWQKMNASENRWTSQTHRVTRRCRLGVVSLNYSQGHIGGW